MGVRSGGFKFGEPRLDPLIPAKAGTQSEQKAGLRPTLFLSAWFRLSPERAGEGFHDWVEV